MKRITFNKIGINRKTKVLAIISAIILILGACMALGRVINAWYDSHYLQFNKVLEIKINKPIEIKEREVKPQDIVKIIEKLPEYKDMNDIEKYICDKWGAYHCATALAIAKSESGLKEDAYNTYNSNGTLDIGIFQVNSVHFSKEGCSLKELVDAKKNIDCAYKIYQASGWNAWSVWKSGAFKEKL
jgi:hypothetical protein